VDEPLAFRRAHSTNISYTYRNKSGFSFRDIGKQIIDEVCPKDLDREFVYAIHSSVAIRNAIANGAWSKAADGLRQCLEALPSQRLYLLSHVTPGLRSFVWMRYFKKRFPPELLRRAMSLRAALRSKRFRTET
jgi:hypothetical protein